MYDHALSCMTMYDIDDFERLHDSVRLFMTMYSIYMILYMVFFTFHDPLLRCVTLNVSE